MTEHRPRSVLVTGGAGFIGSNFVAFLLERDPSIHIINLDKLTYAGSLENLDGVRHHGRHHFVRGDIADRELVSTLLSDHRIDTIVHFAAETHVDRSISGPAEFLRTNVEGTFVLLEAARSAWSSLEGGTCSRRFHLVSTDEVYGTLAPGDPPFTETSRYLPNSPYAASKAAADHLARAYARTYGLPVLITHCSNNYGPRQHAEKFIPTVIRSCVRQAPIPVYGSGTNIRDWLHVTDHCRALELALRRAQPGEVFNIGGGTELSNLELAGKLCDVFDQLCPRATTSRELISFVEDRAGHDFRYAIDCSLLRSRFGWEPRESFEQGLQQTVAWYLERERERSAATRETEQVSLA